MRAEHDPESDQSSNDADGEDAQKARERRLREEAALERKAFERSLRKACEDGRRDAVRRLLDSRVAPSCPNGSGTTPLHEAAFKGHAEVCQLLIDYRVDPSETDTWGGSALHHAAARECLSVVQLLIKARGDVNAMNSSRHMPLDLAQKTGNKKITSILVAEALRVAEERAATTRKSCAVGTALLAVTVSIITFAAYLAGYVGQDRHWLQEAHDNSL
mmetsp:Transcript_93662/g.264350  ORF Transcript_93662/g.264350 Transcript_93662/m.264350 type:complete len:217 (-) Transcript_93662:83-733(-)